MKSSSSIAALAGLLFAFAAQAMATTAPPLTSPEAIVQAQLEAYNRHDLEGFLAFYSDDAVLVNYPDQITQTSKWTSHHYCRQRFKV